MNRFKREIMWAALVLIIALTVLSIYGAFIGAERAQAFFNSIPSAVFWALFGLALVAGLIAFRRLIRVPGLLLMHAGCILVLIGGALGSEKGYKAAGNERVREGWMTIYEGQRSNQAKVEKKIPLFNISVDFAGSLDRRIIPESLRQEFAKQQMTLSQKAVAWISQAQRSWVIADEPNQYFIRREGVKLKVYDFVREMKELPFSIKLNDFRMEYYDYEAPYLEIEVTGSQLQRIPAEIGQQLDLGGELGTAKIVRKFERFKMSLEDGKQVAFEDPHGNPMPALEIEITSPAGEVTRRYAFSLMPGFGHSQSGPKLTYVKPTGGMVSDYISELEVIDKDGKVVAKKDIEVNHPLQYAGYRFYQSSYDQEGGRYTVLQVVSNTGVMVVFAGYWAICVGVVWHMWLRHLFKKIGGKTQTHGN